MVRVCQGPLRKVPGLVPAKVHLIKQNPHQLGHGHAGVRIVELDSDLFGKRAPIGVAPTEAAHEIGQRAGHQKILLHEAQSLSLSRGVVRIEYSREGFGSERLGQRTYKIAAAESLKVEVVRCGGGPEPKCVDGFAAVTHHRAIKRDADQTRRLAKDGAQGPAAHLE